MQRFRFLGVCKGVYSWCDFRLVLSNGFLLLLWVFLFGSTLVFDLCISSNRVRLFVKFRTSSGGICSLGNVNKLFGLELIFWESDGASSLELVHSY
jgi:hypothetical protein